MRNRRAYRKQVDFVGKKASGKKLLVEKKKKWSVDVMSAWVLKDLESPDAKNVVVEDVKEVEASIVFSKKQNG